MIVLTEPLGDDDTGLVDACKPLSIQHLTAQTLKHDAEFLLGRILLTYHPPGIPNRLISASGMAPIPVSHRLPPRGYDEPESLSYAISLICPVSADGEQADPI